MSIKVDSLAEEIMKHINDYADGVEQDVKKAVRKSANTIRKGIADTAPRRPNGGRYAKSWATKTTRETAHSLEVTVHSKDRYQIAHLLEKGHANRGGGRTSARPHIAPAEEAGVELLQKLVERSLRNG